MKSQVHNGSISRREFLAGAGSGALVAGILGATMPVATMASDGLAEADDHRLTVIEGKPGGSSADSYVIRLKIDACGYRMVDTINEEMAAYVTAQYRIFKPQEKLKGELLELTIISRNQRTWDDLTADFDSAGEGFRDVKRRGGTRLANKLVYLK